MLSLLFSLLLYAVMNTVGSSRIDAIIRCHEYSRMRMLAIRSTEDKMVATNPRVI